MHNFKLNSLRPGRFGFGEAIRDAARINDKIIGIGVDITKSVSMNLFADEFPDRFFSLGIAEQNAISVATGMALSGYIPVFSTYGVFASMRAADQIRISACYNNVHIIIGGAHAGISVGPDGATHQALEDIAVMRVLPNMTLLSPCDATQAYLATKAAIQHCSGPVYIRFGREPVPDFTSPDQDFKIGKTQTLHEGNDIAIIATGHLVWPALEAANILKNEGISARIINLHSIKPIDNQTITKAAIDCGAILTAEEHQINGGMGSAVAEVVVRHYPVPMDFIGMEDSFGESGQAEELMNKYGLNSENIVFKAKELIKRKSK